MQWFRFYTEAIGDKKLRRIARDNNETMAHVLGVWTIVLSMASDSPERGRLLISADVPATIDDINDAAGCNVTETFLKLLVTGLVTVDVTDDGKTVYVVPAWDKRQFESDSSATRVRKHRERQKAVQNPANVTEMKRYSNAPDTDTDTDTENARSTRACVREAEPVVPPEATRDDADMTKAIVAKMESIGIGVTQYTVDTYVAAAHDNGIHAVLSGMTAAAEAGRQQRMNYVMACIKNKATGEKPKAPPTNGYNGTGSASGRQSATDPAVLEARARADRERQRTAAKLAELEPVKAKSIVQ